MRRAAVLSAVALLLAGASAAFAQSDEPAAETPATWTMEIVAGASGWVSPAEPVPLRVSLTSDLLLVGRIDAVVGGLTTSHAVEVPAGGVKDYELAAAVPGQRRQLQVRLISTVADEEIVLEEERVTLRVPANDLVVAVVDAAPHESTIRSATPKPYAQDVELVRLQPGELGNLNPAVSYLVIPAAAMADLDGDAVDGIRTWVEEGGRLIGEAANVSRVADPAAGRSFVDAAAVGVTVGTGEVIAAADFGALDAAAWSDLLRAVPQPGIVRVQTDGGASSLIGGALSGRSASVPALPWLLLGILLFVVLVGPVNFILLRGFGKPEWAWVTVPVLSALFVAGFWMVGRSQLQPFTVTHASVIAESSRGAEGRTAFVLQVESGGEHVLAMADGWNTEGQDYPGVTPGVASTGTDGRAVVTYELDDLGVGTAQGAWTGDSAHGLDFAVEPKDGTELDVAVINRGGFTFDLWGVVVDGVGWLAAEELVAGGEVSVAARASSRLGPRYEPVILEAVQRRGFVSETFYESEYQQVFPMATFAEDMAPRIKERGIHFFGFTSDAVHELEIDGKPAESTGRTLFVVEVPDDGSILAARTSARPQLLAVEGASSVEQYYEEIYAYGADAIYFHYTVPNGVATAAIKPGFTSLNVAEVFDWKADEFIGFEWGEQLDLSDLASPTGEVVVRASHDSARQFFEDGLTMARFSLDWS